MFYLYIIIGLAILIGLIYYFAFKKNNQGIVSYLSHDDGSVAIEFEPLPRRKILPEPTSSDKGKSRKAAQKASPKKTVKKVPGKSSTKSAKKVAQKKNVKAKKTSSKKSVKKKARTKR